MKKQKNTLISYLLFYGGFLVSINSIIVIIIYTIVFENYVGNFVHIMLFILIIIGVITPLFASDFNLFFYFTLHNPDYKLKRQLLVDSNKGFIQGVPNNKFKDFNIIEKIVSGIITLEYNDGVFIGEYEDNSITIDMNGWIFKKKYLFELIHTSLKINYVNSRRLPLKYVYSTIIDSDIKSLVLIVRTGQKQKKYFVSSNGVVKSPLILRYKNYIKSKFLDKNKKTSIADFYDLNM